MVYDLFVRHAEMSQASYLPSHIGNLADVE